MKDCLWCLFGNFVLHPPKISVLILALPFMDFQYLCTGSLEQLSCCSHAKLLCSNCSQDFSSPAWIFLSHIYLEQKHFLCSVALPGRFWVCWMDIVGGRQKEESPYSHSITLSIPARTVFVIADSAGRRELQRTEGSSVLKGFDQKKGATAENWQADCWWRG